MLGAALAFLALSGNVSADPARELSPAPAVPADRAGMARACLAAAAEAEARLGLPPGVLAALAVVESAAHPFAIGSASRSRYAASREEAVRIARSAGPGAAGGCFQINIGVHARRDPAWVFDPWASALFAGRMLARHAGATAQDWGAAVARYAGAGPGSDAARRQRCRVAAGLAGLGHPPPRGLGTEGCRPADVGVAREKAVTLAARAIGPEAVALLR
jgi:hypothetical protein